jgi:protein-ribulosamine 3-kinase
MDIWQHLETQISQASGRVFSLARHQNIAGGCINQASRIVGVDQSEYFIKFNRADLLPMFEAEAQALSEMAASNSVRVPQPICSGAHGGQCYLVMEYLPLSGRADMSLLGSQLATMHRSCVSQFGWSIDNTIGSTPQPNQQTHDWIAFWREQRLGFQLELAARKGYRGELQRKGEQLLADFPALFASYTPQASLLHGDLWSGNYGGLANGEPVIFDPATYYGDRETDLAMTTLFGGFGRDFYAAYNDAWPLDEGYSVRKTFYNIYHIINHLNLFGGGYQGQAISMIEQVLAEL